MPIRPENKDRYPPNWPTISNRIRFERAGGRCECAGECGTGHDGRCPAVHRRPHPRTGSVVYLTTAHLNHVPEQCDEANLKAMCQACHLGYDTDHHRETARATRAARRAAAIEHAKTLGIMPLFDLPATATPRAAIARCSPTQTGGPRDRRDL